ncbi:MAG TPA: hypothetical protein PJ991_06325 [Kiritimatiellia bacterium]|nr:hypothetical protein [Kiritimatiellia bacterium]
MTSTPKIMFNVIILLSLMTLSNLLADDLKTDTGASIKFSGSSTLHRFSGTAIPDSLLVETGGVFISVPVKTMKTDNRMRDRSMYHMLGAERFPYIYGRAALSHLRDASDGSTAPIELTIGDLTQTNPATCRLLPGENGVYYLMLDMDVSLKQFELEPPSVMGIMRVEDRVHVEVILPWLEQSKLPVTDGKKNHAVETKRMMNP